MPLVLWAAQFHTVGSEVYRHIEEGREGKERRYIRRGKFPACHEIRPVVLLAMLKDHHSLAVMTILYVKSTHAYTCTQMGFKNFTRESVNWRERKREANPYLVMVYLSKLMITMVCLLWN